MHTENTARTPGSKDIKPSPRRDVRLLQPVPSSPKPGAGRLKLFSHNWSQVTHNNLVLNIVKHGLQLQFHTLPPMLSLPSYSSHSPAMSLEIESLHTKTAIAITTPSADQFVSPIFDVPKKDTGKSRIILNLKILNTYIRQTSFKCEGLDTIIAMLCKNDYFVSIDLKDAYLMFSIFPDFWKFLCFDWKGVRYFYKCMPFGLTSSPRIFTKVLKVVLTFLRSRGLRVSAWFDDIVIVASSVNLLLEHLYFAKLILKSLGFLINDAKSSFAPSQSLSHLGFLWDSVTFTLAVPEDKVRNLKLLCEKALVGLSTLRFLNKILGTVESFRVAFPFAALHYRGLQRDVASLVAKGNSWDTLVRPSVLACNDLRWWISCPLSLPPRTLEPFVPHITVTTDSSSHGWGAFTSDNDEAFGFWSDVESLEHNNVLETRAVLFAIKSLLREVSNSSILIRSDNSTTVSYINNQGGVHSPVICDLIFDIYEFCEVRNLRIQASFLRGIYNERADALSRRSRAHSYSLSDSFFSILCDHFSLTPKIDLFASRLNFKLPQYYSEGPDPQSSGFDAFLMPWPSSVYAFPPIHLVNRFLSRFIKLHIHTGLVIAPFWPSQAFFPLLLDLLIDSPVLFSVSRIRVPHALPPKLLKFLACAISSTPDRQRAFHQNLQVVSSGVSKSRLSALTAEPGASSPIGVTSGRLVTAISL